MKTSEQFAIDEWLWEYPKNATFDDILYLLLDADDTTVVPCGVVSMPRRELADCIANTQTHFANVTNER
jgi:hypothetical protein